LNGDLGLLVKSSIHISLGWSTPLYLLLHKTVSGKQTWKIAGNRLFIDDFPIPTLDLHENPGFPSQLRWTPEIFASKTPRSRDI
jgi:hypothetical protein